MSGRVWGWKIVIISRKIRSGGSAIEQDVLEDKILEDGLM